MFRALVAGPVLRAAAPHIRSDADHAGNRMAAVSLALALVAGVLWLLAQTAEIGDARTLAETFDVTRVVLGETLFGHALLLRFALLLAAAAVWRARPLAASLALAAAAAEAGMGHAIASGSLALAAANALHVAAAGAWLGALLPLRVFVRAAPGAAARATAMRFAPLGVACVLTLIATAVVQGRALIGGVPGLIGTGYGRVAALEIALLGVLIACAAINHRWLAPAAATRPERLVRSIALEAAVGVAIMAAAARLSQMDPGRTRNRCGRSRGSRIFPCCPIPI